MCRDALERRESCGGHFREEWQDDGEAKRDDENFCHAAVWEHKGEVKAPVRHQEPLDVRERAPRRPELQVSAHPAHLASVEASTEDDFKQDGKMVRYELDHVSPDMSFLEMLDVLNEQLTKKGEEPVAFDHDCREGICGSCGVMIDGEPHGPRAAPRPASCTCAASATAPRSGSSRGAPPAFPVSRTSSSTAARSTASCRPVRSSR
jgi:hypothetical protein